MTEAHITSRNTIQDFYKSSHMVRDLIFWCSDCQDHLQISLNGVMCVTEDCTGKSAIVIKSGLQSCRVFQTLKIIKLLPLTLSDWTFHC